MKKFLLMFICVSLIILTGCEIHFSDGTRYDVPWWFAFCFFTLPFLIAGLLFFISQMPRNFWAVCQKCGTRFYVKKRVVNFSSATPEHFEFITKCPHCNEKTMCTRSYDQDE